MKVEVCFSPALYPHYNIDNENTIVVVVDIFRATTTMCAAFYNGVQSIIPVADIAEAQRYKSQGFLVGAERNVKRCDFADFGNSPFEYTRERVEKKQVVLTTTNGTQAIETAMNCYQLLIGAFSNITSIANHCQKERKNVLILCSGWNNRFNMEDTLFAGALCKMLCERNFSPASDAANVALDMWQNAQPNVRNYLSRSEHLERLVINNLSDSVDYCLTMDTTPLLPAYDKGQKAIFLL